MTKEVTVSAKTIEAAIELASQMLGKKAEELEIKVLEQPKKGFLGMGASEAKIVAGYEPTPQEVTQEFLETFLKNSGFENVSFECKINQDNEIGYTLNGEGLGILIGHHGEVLDSLQYLLNLVMNRQGNEFTRVTLDIENYRSKREETLKQLARKTALRVKKSKRNVTFEPMSSYERRIIHSEVQDIEGVTTHSIGTGEDRRIVMSSTEAGRKNFKSKKKEATPEKPKVVYEYNPPRTMQKSKKAKSIEEINLADIEDTEMVNL